MNRVREFALKMSRQQVVMTVASVAAGLVAAAGTIPWWTASLISNVAIIATEYVNRYAVGSWASVLPTTLPLIIVAQFCLFRAFNGAPHWMWAWGVFTIGNSFMRIGAVSAFGEDGIHSWPHVILGVTIMVGGALFMKTGLSAS